MKVTRTYPQPDSPKPNIGPRERALAVFKYLLGLEPEQAKDHPLFACIVHSYEQEYCTGMDNGRGESEELEPSLVEELTSTFDVDVPQGHKL